MHARCVALATFREQTEHRMCGGKQPVAGNASVCDSQGSGSELTGKFVHGHNAHMGGIVVEVQRKLSCGTRQINRLGMRRLKINEATGFKQSRNFAEKVGQRIQMFDDVHTGDDVHRTVGPRKFVRRKIETAKVAPGWISLWVTKLVGGMKAEIRAKLCDVIERFAIR